MSIVYAGSLTLGAAIPGATAAAAAGASGIGLALPDIQARLAALLAFNPQPIDFAADLVLAQQMVTSLSAAIALGLTPPSMAAQIAAINALIAELLANVSAVNAQLEIILAFQGLLASAGVHTYAYAGPVNAFGSEFSAELSAGVPGGSPTQASNAVVLLTTIGATWDAMAQVFKVGP